MEKQFYNTTSAFVQDNYHKALERFERNVQSGRFATFTQHKKRQIWNRLCRYARQLGVALRPTLTAACLAAGLSLTTPVSAQTFTAQTGAANPFNGVNDGFASAPTFVDIDGDGDKDAFIGVSNGTINYYKNTGTAAAAVYTAQTGAANPFNGVDIGFNSTPTFVDIDGDGDQDAFIGANDGTINYYKNTGTAAAAVYTAQTGAANPFNGVDVGSSSTPTFVDIDGDGDQDAFIGANNGIISYYKNTGIAVSPVYTAQTGAANPFNGINVVSFSAPTLVDIDSDGDQDAFIGANDGTIKYYKNTGTAAAPVFTVQTGAANPLNGINVGYNSFPTFVDIDGDGDQDAFIGANGGTIKYYKNTSVVLPVELVSFTARHQGMQNVLTWRTASEVNNKDFEVQRLAPPTPQREDNWETLGFLTANNKASTYDFTDNTPLSMSYYRLRQIDNDGKETLSKVISISQKGNSKLITYPNPVSHILTVETENMGDYQILNLLGQQVLSGKAAAQIDVSALLQGSYFLKMGAGQVQFTKF